METDRIAERMRAAVAAKEGVPLDHVAVEIDSDDHVRITVRQKRAPEPIQISVITNAIRMP